MSFTITANRLERFAGVLVGALLFSATAAAQCGVIEEEAKLGAADSAAGDNFGQAVTLALGRAAVGAPDHDLDPDNPATSGHGAAYVFVYDSVDWSQEQKLTAGDAIGLDPEAFPDDHFGAAVSMDRSESWVFVGVPFGEDLSLVTPVADVGAGDVFQWDGAAWNKVQRLVASDGLTNDRFGQAIAVSDWAAVGAPLADGPAGSNQGAVYPFYYSTASIWTEGPKLTPMDAQNDDRFGSAVAVDLDATRILVGAPLEDNNGGNAGSAYVFVRDDAATPSDPSDDIWSEEQQLAPNDPAAGDQFGFSVAIVGDWILIGAPNNDEFGADAGAAYLFQFNGSKWDQVQKLNALLPSDGDHFGRAVALDLDTTMAGEHLAIVGAPEEDVDGGNSGAAYSFEYDGAVWNAGAILRASDASSGDEYGGAVAAVKNQGDGEDQDRALAGAGFEDQSGADSGAAYVTVVTAPPVWESYCTGKLNSDGCVPFVSAQGIPSTTAGSGFDIYGDLIVPNKPGIYFYGINSQRANISFLQGTLCFMPPLRRTPPIFSGGTTGVACSGQYVFDFNQWIADGVSFVAPGDQVNGQFWYRDPGHDDTQSGLTDAIEFVPCE